MKRVIPLIAAAMVISGCANVHNNSEPEVSTTEKATLVFVHGAHLTADSWQETTRTLKAKGFNTLAVNLPGRNTSDNPHDITLNASSQALCDAIKPIKAPIMFVAHSQGGAVTNHALSICPQKNITGMIYVAAVAPKDGEKPFALLNKSDETNYFKGVTFDEKSGWMTIHDKAAFASVFTNSTSSKVKTQVMNKSVNEPAVIGDGVVHFDNNYFSGLKTFYIHTKFDQIISPESQKKIASNMTLNGSVEIETGHVPMLSAPEQLASHIETFVTK